MRTLICATLFSCLLGSAARAEEIAGTMVLDADVTYSGLTGSGTLTADAGETPIVVTVAGDADSTFNGTIQGNIRLVKSGAGVLTLAAANSFTGGLRIEGGSVSVSAANQLGGGELVLAGGALDVTASLAIPKTQAKSVVGSGTLRVASDKTLTINGQLDITGATLTVAGAGIVLYNQTFSGCGTGGSIEITGSATFRGGWGSSLGGGASNWGLASITVREGATLAVQEGCTIWSELILEGGTLQGIVTQQNLDKSTGRLDWPVRTPAVCLNGPVRVKASSTSSRIVSLGLGLSSDAQFRNVFDVEAGAALTIDAAIYPGRTLNANGGVVDYSQLAGQGFDKTGAGALTLVKPATLGGIVGIKGGSLTLARDAYLSKAATVLTENGAKLVLRDGSVFESGLGGINGLLAQADVWLDASSLALEVADGAQAAAVPNRGTAGGYFRPGATGTATSAPTLSHEEINGLPALCFTGSESLILTNFVNSTTYEFCSYCVHAKQKGWNTSIVLETGPSTWELPEGVTYTERMKPESYELYHSSDRQMRQTFNYAAWNGTSNPYRSWDSKSFVYPEDAPDGSSPMLSFGRCYRLANGKGSAQAWYRFDDSTCTNLGVGTVLDAYKISPRRIDTVNLGCRTLLGRETTSGGHVRIGEVVMFARALTAAESLAIESYLRRKWFASSLAAPEMTEGQTPSVTVEVATGETAVFAGKVCTIGGEGFANSARLEKTGEGKLHFRGDARGADIRAQGPLAFDAGAETRAAVWLDATDATSETLAEDGHVVAFANKGRAGGAFVRGHVGNFEDTDDPNKYWVAGPTLNAAGINGRRTLSFDGNQGLLLTSYTNYNAAGANDLHVYAVLKRNSFLWQDNEDGSRIPVNGKGVLGAAFAMGLGATGAGSSSVADIEQDGAFVPLEYGKWVNNVATNYFINYMGKASAPGSVALNNVNVYPMRSCPTADATESEYLFVGHFNKNGLSLATLLPADDPAAMNLSTRGNGGVAIDGISSFNAKQIDTVTLGGRFWSRKGTHPTFRWWKVGDGANYMWNGEIGEFIVFDQGLTREDETALVAYLRKKWFGAGEGSETPPTCLAGASVAPQTDAQTALTVLAGEELLPEVTSGVAKLALESLSLPADAVLVRQNVTSRESVAMFGVAGDLALAGPVKVDLGLTRAMRRDWGAAPIPFLTFGTLSGEVEAPAFRPLNATVLPLHEFVTDEDAKTVSVSFGGGLILLVR